MEALSLVLSGVLFACLAGMAHLSARQERRWRGLDSPNPLLRSGGFGRRPLQELSGRMTGVKDR